MNKKILVGSILAAALLALLPMSSVIGSNLTNTNAEKRNSPLFAARVNNVLQKGTGRINTNYIGKGRIFPVFITKKSSLDGWIDKAIKLINFNPAMLDKLLDQIENIPGIINVFKQNGLEINDFKHQINIIKNNPMLLKEEIDKAVELAGESLELSITDPEPLGFSGQPGCLLTFFIILPIIVMIVTMIATFTIITCLNIGGCFERLWENIAEGFQGLTPP